MKVLMMDTELLRAVQTAQRNAAGLLEVTLPANQPPGKRFRPTPPITPKRVQYWRAAEIQGVSRCDK